MDTQVSLSTYLTDYGRTVIKEMTIPKDENGNFVKCSMYDIDSAIKAGNLNVKLNVYQYVIQTFKLKCIIRSTYYIRCSDLLSHFKGICRYRWRLCSKYGRYH